MGPKEQAKIVEVILRALRVGNTRQDAYTFAGITTAVFYRWLRDDEEFEKKVMQAEAQAKVGCVTRISQAASNGSWQAAAWILERRYPREWGKVENLDVRLKGMTRDELKQFVAERLGPLDGQGARTPRLESGGSRSEENDQDIIIGEIHEVSG